MTELVTAKGAFAEALVAAAAAPPPEGEEPSSPFDPLEVAKTLHDVGTTVHGMAQYDKAIFCYKTALQLRGKELEQRDSGTGKTPEQKAELMCRSP